MNEIEKYIDNQFFIIDSNNLNSVESKLFGFAIYNENIIFANDMNENIKLNGDGVYVRILKNENEIYISQDFNGSYGIYLYDDGSQFVISNSFIKLVDYLKDKYHISINNDVALSFIPSDLCSIVYTQTMINEIEFIPRNHVIKININNRTLKHKKINYNENTIPIDSKEGIEILDNWFYKWISIFRKLKMKTNDLKIDLTGGFDSRIVFALLLNSNIDLNKINIYSVNDETHREDYEIASIIAKKYNFKLNMPFIKKDIKINDIQNSINIIYNVKLGFHKYFDFPKTINKNPVYYFGGFGGESLREYWKVRPKDYIKTCKDRAAKYSEEFVAPTINVLINSFKQLQKDFSIEDEQSKKLTELLYKEVRNRTHFGKIAVTYYLTNQIKLSPLLDYNLHKIKKSDFDENLLFALIFTRYCPELLDIKFDNEKSLNKDTIKYANEINKKYPFNIKDLTYISDPIEMINKNNIVFSEEDYYNQINPDEFIENVFLSNAFKQTFEMHFSSNLYSKIINEVQNKKFQPLSLVHASIAVLKIINAVNYNNEKFSKNQFDWLNGFLKIKKFEDNQLNSNILDKIIKYDIARLDIKNKGNRINNINIISISDKFSKIMTPDWFSDDEGKGYVIESHANKINIKFKCLNDGELNISLKSKDIRDKNRKHFPIFIDFTKFIINEEEILKTNELVHCNKPYIYKKIVKNNEIINLELEWLPFNSNSLYEIK